MPLPLLGLLAPAVLALAPDLARWLIGPRAAEVAQRTVEVVQAFTGTEDPVSATAAIANLPPEKRMELQLRLAEIAANEAKAQREYDLAVTRSDVENTVNARAQTIELAKLNSSLAWMPAIQSFAVTGLFSLTLLALLLNFAGVASLQDGFRDILMALVGALTVEFRGVCQYWVGGSRAGGQAAMAGLQRAVISGPPTAPVVIPTPEAPPIVRAARSIFGR